VEQDPDAIEPNENAAPKGAAGDGTTGGGSSPQ
jgi:hypothetical protein